MPDPMPDPMADPMPNPMADPMPDPMPGPLANPLPNLLCSKIQQAKAERCCAEVRSNCKNGKKSARVWPFSMPRAAQATHSSWHFLTATVPKSFRSNR